MNVRDELVLLSQLAVADLSLKELQDQKKGLPKKAIEADEKAKSLGTQVSDLEAKNADFNIRRRKLELDLQNDKSNLRKWEARAHQIRAEREYTSLMSEIGSQKRTISDLEDQILELMESQEAVAAQLKPLVEALGTLKKISEEEWALVKDDLAELDLKIADALALRQSILAKLSVITSRRYEQIASKRGGVGVAFVKKEVCQACSRVLPPELSLRVMKGEIIEQCPSCFRMLTTSEMVGIPV